MSIVWLVVNRCWLICLPFAVLHLPPASDREARVSSFATRHDSSPTPSCLEVVVELGHVPLALPSSTTLSTSQTFNYVYKHSIGEIFDR